MPLSLPTHFQKITPLLTLFVLSLSVYSQSDYREVEREAFSEAMDSLIVESIEQLTDSISITDPQIAPLQQLRLYKKLSELYFENELFSEALKTVNLALDFQKGELKTHPVFIDFYLLAGKIELISRNLDAVISNADKAIELSIATKQPSLHAAGLALKGEAFEKTGDAEKSLQLQNKSLAIYLELNDTLGIATVYSHLGSVYEDLREEESALKYFLKSYELIAHTENELVPNVLNNLGDGYGRTKQYAESIAHYQAALQVAEQTHNLRELNASHEDISEILYESGDYEGAYKHLELAYLLEGQINELQNRRQINVLNAVHDTKERDSQIKLLQKKDDLNSIRQRTLLISIGALILLVVLYFLYLKKQQRTQIELREYREKLLSSEIEKQKIEESNLRLNIRSKTKALSSYSLHLSQKNNLLSDISHTLTELMRKLSVENRPHIKTLIKKIDHNIKSDSEWDDFKVYFEQIHPEFIQNLGKVASQPLTPADIRIAMLIRLNLTSKEIASILRVSPDSVRVSRHRLRKKLAIDHESSLVGFLAEI
ncbi:MAG: tetratricopeptide repeat protein [Bacteroidetes bacterium]|nr:MAG: tetratricopeptide repeat protein [Bacteroidota bacterium]